MLTLYNAGASVCSVKARLALAEKNLEWEDILLSLPKGEQHEPDYLTLNPNDVVPTLVHDDLVIIESSVIAPYVDELRTDNRLMPYDTATIATTRVWLLRCLEIHSAINTITFSTVNRDTILKSRTPQQITEPIARMPDPKMAEKRRDLLDKGLDSYHVVGDFYTLKCVFDDMQVALEKTRWLTGESYARADAALLAYVDRLSRFGMDGFWKERTPAVGDWLKAVRARPAYTRAMDRYINSEEAAATVSTGARHWPAVKERWETFLG